MVCNLHASTPTVNVGIAIEEIGFSVRQVSSVLQKIIKNNLTMFFVNLEPAEPNKDIFGITSLLNTKITIEESHKSKYAIQRLNCQNFGHTRSYCAFPPRCVHCGGHYPFSSCSKSNETPNKCAL